MLQEEYINNIAAGIIYDYLVFLPSDYNSENKNGWPLVIFLHGAFERGSNVQDVKKNALPKLAIDEDFPFIIVAPQCPSGEHWKPEQVQGICEKVKNDYSINHSRIYLTGLSMGGFATWQTAIRFPELFAAIIPICGGGNVSYAKKLKKMPIWAFHGKKDKVIPYHQSVEMVDGVNASGGNAKLTLYPNAPHDSWTETYQNKEIYTWLLSHTRN